MKTVSFFLLLIVFAAGCKFQRPDYLTTVTPADLNQAMQKEDIFLVDVHTPEQQHIKGTDSFIPYDEVEKYTEKLPQDKNAPIYLYCKAGPMGNAAAKKLHELGYQRLFNLDGGADAWKKAGLAFE